MDGHATHTHGPNLQLCLANNIDVCFLPPHTSHITQPLDVGIFGSYKAAFRKSSTDPALDELRTGLCTEATKVRARMLGRSLSSQLFTLNSKTITNAFKKTGIYPLSFDRFITNCFGVRGIPADVRIQAEANIKALIDAEAVRVQNKRRRVITDALHVVTFEP